MPYISRIYKDTYNLQDSFTKETQLACLEESKKGNVPIVILTGNRSLTFYVSRDVRIDEILSSISQNESLSEKFIEKAFLFQYDVSKKMYTLVSPLSISSSSLEELYGMNRIKVVFHLKQDPVSHLLK